MQKSWINFFLLLVVQIVFWFLLFKIQFLSIFWYKNITCLYNGNIGKFASMIDFPIGELFYCLVLIILTLIVFNLFSGKNLNNKLRTLFLALNIVLFIYQTCWGIVYKVEKININTDELKVEVNDLKDLYCNYIYKTNEVRELLNNNYSKTIILETSDEIIIDQFKKQSMKIGSINWIKNYKLIKNPTFKISKASSIMSSFGILGYYNPFTIESNINGLNSDLKHTTTVYHELAHQMGFASENEANFISFLIGYHSNVPEIKYATLFKVSFSILNSINRVDPLFVKLQLEELPKSIKEDYDREKKYYEQFQGFTQDVFSELNNQFLRANNQDGTISYSKYILLVNYYNKKELN